MRRLNPVSYTHLDVYKRQVIAPFLAVAFVFATRRLDPNYRDASRADIAVTEPPA